VKSILKKIPFKKAKLLLAGIGIVCFLGVIVVLTLTLSEQKENLKPPPVPKNPQGADILINNFHYTSTNDQGVKEWELKANTASYFQDKKTAGFEKVNVIFYSREGRIFTVQGDQGTLNTEAKDFKLSGNVVGTSSDGYKFRTESLTYTADNNEARTDKKVFLESPQFNLEGMGMVLDIKNQKLFLLKNVMAKGTK